MMTFELKYGLDVENYKASYDRLGLVGYMDSNYTNDTKSRQLIIDYIYCLNRITIS